LYNLAVSQCGISTGFIDSRGTATSYLEPEAFSEILFGQISQYLVFFDLRLRRTCG
jgi:hypothetical protein